MNADLWLIFSAFLSSYAGVAAIRRWALKRGFMDVPVARSSHRNPVPRVGGLAVSAIFLLGILVLAVSAGSSAPKVWLGLLGAMLLVGTVSLMDDLKRGIPVLTRLAAHCGAGLLLVITGGPITRVGLDSSHTLAIGAAASVLTVLWVAGLTNCYNFMDGIDGMAAAQACVAGLNWAICGWVLHMPWIRTMSLVVVGASLGFYFHNRHPAKIFLGDVGSATLGLIFAGLPLVAFNATLDSRLALFSVLAVGPFLADGASTLFFRALSRRNIFESHRDHYYQRLVDRGYSQNRVSAGYAIVAAGSGLAGIAGLMRGQGPMLAGLAGLCVLTLICEFTLRTRGRITAQKVRHGFRVNDHSS